MRIVRAGHRTAIVGVTLVMGAVYVIVNAFVDLAQVAADPRLRAR